MFKGYKFWGSPGTGKTTKMLQALDEILAENYGFQDVCFCTYRKNMAYEFKRRLAKQYNLPDDKKTLNQILPFFSTIHGVCLRLLSKIEEHGVITREDHENFCETYRFEVPPPPKIDDEGRASDDETTFFGRYLKTRSWLINRMREDRDCVMCNMDRPLSVDEYEFMNGRWRTWKEENNKIDFDDMLVFALQKKLIPPTRILMVDEFQDVTPIQYEIYKLWRDASQLTFIAGDPNQSIYGFLGASPDYFKDEDLEQIILTSTYRLPKDALENTESILEYGGLEVPEGVVSVSPIEGQTNKVTLDNFIESIDFSQHTFFLCRTNYWCHEIRAILSEAGIIFVGRGGWGNRMISVYNSLLMLQNRGGQVEKEEWVDFLKCVRREYSLVKKKILEDKPKYFLPNLTQVDFATALSTLPILQQGELLGVPFDMPRIFTKAAFSESAANQINRALTNFKRPVRSGVGIEVMTVHASKGREADVVFVLDASSSKIQNACLLDDVVAAEEVRVMYVACSRHRKRLFIVEAFGEGDRCPLTEIICFTQEGKNH
jgi:hypothetical protein